MPTEQPHGATRDNYGILLNNVQAAVTAWPQQGGTDEKPDGLENDKAQKITLYKDNAANGVYYYPMQKKYDYTSTVTPPIKPTKPSAPQNRK